MGGRKGASMRRGREESREKGNWEKGEEVVKEEGGKEGGSKEGI